MGVVEGATAVVSRVMVGAAFWVVEMAPRQMPYILH